MALVGPPGTTGPAVDSPAEEVGTGPGVAPDGAEGFVELGLAEPAADPVPCGPLAVCDFGTAPGDWDEDGEFTPAASVGPVPGIVL